MPEVPDTVDDALDALSSPSTDEVFDATRAFSSREIGSSAVSRAGGGGGSQPWPFNYYGSIATGGSSIMVPSGGGGALAVWEQAGAQYHPGQAAAFFDLTDPATPVVLADGNYSFNMEGTIDGGSAGFFEVVLYIDPDGMDDGPGNSLPLAGLSYLLVGLTCNRFLAAGTEFQLFLYQTAGTTQLVDTWMQVSKEATT